MPGYKLIVQGTFAILKRGWLSLFCSVFMESIVLSVVCCMTFTEPNSTDQLFSVSYMSEAVNETLGESEYDLLPDVTSDEFSLNASSMQQNEPHESHEPSPYYGDYFRNFKHHYLLVHGYLGVTVCIFGIFANVLNIIVLSQKEMISPTNAILTGLAVADMLVMTSYLPFCIHNYVHLNQPLETKFSYGWAVFTLFHAHFTVVCHTISIWLTVTLAIWRFMAVTFPAASKTWCSMTRAKFAIVSTYVNCAIFCLPAYFTFKINRRDIDGKPVFHVGFSEIARSNELALEKINFWMFSVLTKLIPCIALTGLSLGLIRVLYEANRRRQRLKNRAEHDKTHDRTTRMLLAILLLFLITEFPSGILALLSGILGKVFFQHVYRNFGELIDLLALVNSAINFILYCSMSRQFRDTFSSLFGPKVINKWISVDNNTTAETTCV